MSTSSGKNRRYRNAKISEHRLRRVVDCFARDLTAAATVQETKLSAPTVNLIFQRLRERMRDHGLLIPNFQGQAHPLAAVFNPKHHGVPVHLHDLHAIERIHRVLCAQHLKGFERLPASDQRNIDKAVRLLKLDASQAGPKRYQIWEAFKQVNEATGTPVTRPFDPRHVRSDSDILINERHLSRQAAFFAYLWQLLLRHPL